MREHGPFAVNTSKDNFAAVDLFNGGHISYAEINIGDTLVVIFIMNNGIEVRYTVTSKDARTGDVQVTEK